MSLKITLVQMDIAWGDPAKNWSRAESAILAAPDSDLYVLPEMFSTGFATEPEDIAERAVLNADGTQEPASLDWMKSMAERTGAAVAGSVAVCLDSDGTFRNRFYFVKPDGSVSYYDKHHLFTYGGEHLRYTAGNSRTVVEWRGVRFLLLVCYDLRFPVWARNHGDYDCILYVASWPVPRIAAWETLLHARAIENQCYVAGVDRTGVDPSCTYCGGTMLIDPYGKDVCACPRDVVATVTGEIDMPSLEAFRLKFPVLSDRD